MFLEGKVGKNHPVVWWEGFFGFWVDKERFRLSKQILWCTCGPWRMKRLGKCWVWFQESLVGLWSSEGWECSVPGPPEPLNCYKVWEKHQESKWIPVWEKVRKPRFSSSWETPGIKEFCIFGCWEAREDVVISGFHCSRAQHFHSWAVVWGGFNRAQGELEFVPKAEGDQNSGGWGVCSKAQELI